MKYLQILSVALSLALLVASAGKSEAGEPWRVVELTGAAKISRQGVVPVVASNDQTVPGDSWIETAATGRVVLLRGQEVVIVGPNSRLKLAAVEVDGNTQILQTLGTALYLIGKQKKPHFQVDTPYLAAVVKGTTFTVTVDQNASSVHVAEGLVEVVAPGRKDVEFVGAGFTGKVSNSHRAEVYVVRDRTVASPPRDGRAQDTTFYAPATGKLELNSAKANALIKPRLVMTSPRGIANVSAASITGIAGSVGLIVLLLTLLLTVPKALSSTLSAVKAVSRNRKRN
jgi:hypothetical protein